MKKRTILILLTLISSLFYFITPEITGNATIEKEYGPNIEMYFCPQDNCGKHLQETLEQAKEEISCAFFDLDLKNIIDTLEAKYEEGLKVSLVIDGDNKKESENLEFVTIEDSSRYMHNKFCIIDNNIIWTGSFNPTTRGDTKNNNNAIKIQSKQLAKNYNQEFTELKNKIYNKGTPTTNPPTIYNDIEISSYFCPEDECSEKIINEIKKANKEILFLTFSFTHKEIADEIIKKLNQEVTVKGVFEKSQNSKYSQKHTFDLYTNNMKLDTNPANMHHKVFIVDKETIITGSFNPSTNADKYNDENILIIKNKEIATKFIEEFYKIYQ